MIMRYVSVGVLFQCRSPTFASHPIPWRWCWRRIATRESLVERRSSPR